MKKYFLLIITFLIFFIITLDIYSSDIVLKNGVVLKGILLEINKENLKFRDNNIFFTIDLIGIEYIYPFENNELKIIYEHEKVEKAAILKIVTEGVFIRNINSNKIKFISFKYINDFKKEGINISYPDIAMIDYSEQNDIKENMNEFFNTIELSKEINKDYIEREKTISENGHDYFDIGSSDYYENFWTTISNFLKQKTKNTFWGLLEEYSEKENELNILNYENKRNIIDVIKDNTGLRNEFYYRVKRIIYNIEYTVKEIKK